MNFPARQINWMQHGKGASKYRLGLLAAMTATIVAWWVAVVQFENHHANSVDTNEDIA